MNIYDKALWHIDGGENAEEVISRFNEVINFLCKYNMLSDEGQKIYESEICEDISLNSDMLNEKGNEFMDKYYDEIILNAPDNITEYAEKKLSL